MPSRLDHSRPHATGAGGNPLLREPTQAQFIAAQLRLSWALEHAPKPRPKPTIRHFSWEEKA